MFACLEIIFIGCMNSVSHVNNVVCVILFASCGVGLEWLHLQKESVCFSKAAHRDKCLYDNHSCTTIVKILQDTLTIRTNRSVDGPG